MQWRLQRARIEALAKRYSLENILTPAQLPFGLDKARRISALCTRRSGKTTAGAAKLGKVAREKAGSVALYITLSRVNAKRLMWPILKQMNEAQCWGATVLESELCLLFPNTSRIYLSGCNDEGELEKFRGLALSLVVIDEAQSFPPYLQKLINEVLSPALMDFAGQLILMGTPGPVPVGYFHDVCHSTTWSHHSWSVQDNPYILAKSGRTPQQLLDEELANRGVTIEDPVIQREWFGRWVLDTNSLVFHYDVGRNARTAPPHQYYVIGVDIGFDDADALVVLGWSDDSPALDLVYEWVGAKQTISKLMAQVQALHTKYKPLAIVADTGGLGKKIVEEIQQRTGIPIEAADKARKLEHIELLNDALRTGRFFAPADSRFASDAMLVEWDKTNPEKPKISDRFHSDVLDAALYAYMRALHWLHVPPPPPPPPLNSAEWREKVQAETKQAIEDAFESQFEANRQQQREDNEADQWA